MNIDFHYGVVYVAARIGGMTPSNALTVAHACQYVDDATTSGILRFKGGETFERFATAYKLFDYSNTENDLNAVSFLAGSKRRDFAGKGRVPSG
jgi:hypothetical protein